MVRCESSMGQVIYHCAFLIGHSASPSLGHYAELSFIVRGIGQIGDLRYEMWDWRGAERQVQSSRFQVPGSKFLTDFRGISNLKL